MPEPVTPPTLQAGDGGSTSPQAGNTTPSDPQAGEETISLEEARKLRQEAKALRARLKTIDDAKAAEEAANLSELQRTAKELDAHKQQIQQYRDQIISEKIINAALTRGILNPELIAPYILSKLEKDDQGMPTNLDKVLEAVVKDNPTIVKTAENGPRAAPAIGANSPARSSTTQPGTLPPGRITLDQLYRDYKK